jgi:galactarate dehydratase
MSMSLPTNPNGGTPRSISMHPADNVAIVVNEGGLPAGTVMASGLTLVDRVPQGHKLALNAIAKGAEVRRYNVPIGLALKDIPAGAWVHERLLHMPEARSLDNLPQATAPAWTAEPLNGYSFEGYRNVDGSVGTRNILAITTTVQCVAGVVDFAVQRIKAELLPLYPHVDDVIGLEHAYGCGVAIDAPDAIIPIRTLRNISKNPNFGGEVMVVSLGCEKLQPERLLPPGSIPLQPNEALDVVCLQADKHVGFMSMIDSVLASAVPHLKRLNARRRETIPASELVVGVQCGGSDAFSGVTANPAVGYCTDLLVRAGATVMFSETTEVRDAIEQMTARATTPEIADAMAREMAWYDAYLGRGQADHAAAHSAEYADAGAGGGHAEPGAGDPGGGDPVVPGRGHADHAALAGGADPHRQSISVLWRVVVGGVPFGAAGAHRAVGEPAGRLAARRPEPEAQLNSWRPLPWLAHLFCSATAARWAGPPPTCW